MAPCHVSWVSHTDAPRRFPHPRDLVEKLAVLRVECDKCGRAGRYRVTTLAKTIGWDGKLTDWLYNLTKDCPRKNNPGLSDRAPRSARICRGCFEKEKEPQGG
jgi:hypothetical protein